MSARDFITHNFWVKLLSVLLATMIWITIYTYQKGHLFRPPKDDLIERTFYRQPVAVMSTSIDERCFRANPATVEITVAGQPAFMRNLSFRDIEVFVNMTDSPGTNAYTKKIRVYHSPEIEVQRIHPTEVKVEVIHSHESTPRRNP